MTALRYDDWKVIFLEHRYPQTLQAWAEPWTVLRIPLLFNLRRDPYERSQITSNTYYDWLLDRIFILNAAGGYVNNSLPPSRSSHPARSRDHLPSVMPRRRSSAPSDPRKISPMASGHGRASQRERGLLRCFS
jgi:hypothetical protein